MRTHAKTGENPPAGFMCPGGWEVLVSYYQELANRRIWTVSCCISLDLRKGAVARLSGMRSLKISSSSERQGSQQRLIFFVFPFLFPPSFCNLCTDQLLVHWYPIFVSFILYFKHLRFWWEPTTLWTIRKLGRIIYWWPIAGLYKLLSKALQKF